MKKILVIRFSSLGDVVLTTPVYRNLKEYWPDCSITVLTKSAYADILEGNPYIDRIIRYSKSNHGLWACVNECRQGRYDIVIDLHNTVRSFLIRAFSGIPVRIVYKKDIWARRMLVWNKTISPILERHTIERYLNSLNALGLKPKLYPPQVFPRPAGIKTRGPSRILVIQTAFLGDAVLTTPLIASLKEEWLQAAISVLCTPATKDIFSGHPAIEELIVYDKKGDQRGLSAFVQLGRRLKSKNFDIAIIPHRSFRSAVLAKLAAIPRRVGFATSSGRWFLTDKVPFSWSTHDVERNLLLLRALGLEGKSKQMHVAGSRADQSDLEKILEEHNVKPGTKLVGLVPGSVWATKRWLPERFGSVADILQQDGFSVVLVGGAADWDSAVAVEKSMATKPINLVKKTSLKQAAALLARCSVVLTNDSGPMHLAVAVGTPTVAIFGSTTRELGFFPYGPGHTVVEKGLSCRPCGLHGHNRCPLDHFRCMKDITVEEVYRAMKKQLAVNAR